MGLQFPFPSGRTVPLNPLTLLFSPTGAPFLPITQRGMLVPKTTSVSTGVSGVFSPLFGSSTPIYEGQLLNFSGDTVLVASDSQGNGAIPLAPSGVGTYSTFNFGPIDLSKVYVAGQSLSSDELHVYMEL